MTLQRVVRPYEVLIRYDLDGAFQGASIQHREFVVDEATGERIGGERITDPSPVTREQLAEHCAQAAADALAVDAELRAQRDAALADLAKAREALTVEQEARAAEVAALTAQVNALQPPSA